MALKQVMETYEFLDTPKIKKADVTQFLNDWGIQMKEIEFTRWKWSFSSQQHHAAFHSNPGSSGRCSYHQ